MVYFQEADIILSSIGGLIIGIGTSLNFVLKGRVTGFSGIFYTLTSLEKDTFHWKAGVFCGLLSAVAVLYDIFKFDPVWDNARIFDPPETMIGNLDFYGFAIAGLLSGIGSKMSNGCTSGHAICGLPRFSKRSWLSVCIFMPVSIGISSLRYYKPFLQDTNAVDIIDSFDYKVCSNVVLAIAICLLLILLAFYHRKQQALDVFIGFVTGIFFGTGLGFAGMFRRTRINGLLTLNSQWDPSPIFMMGVSVFINAITFNYTTYKMKKPLLCETISVNKNNKIDLRLIVGSVIFGLSWGLGGICPGTGMGLISLFSLQISIVWLSFLFIGQQLVALYDKYQDRKQSLTKVHTISSIPEGVSLSDGAK